MLYKKFLNFFFRFRKSKWDFEKYFSSHFIEMRILRWESHLSSPKWELWTENLISLRMKWDFEMRIFFLTSEMRFWNEILISKSHLPRSEKIITKEILFWTSLTTSSTLSRLFQTQNPMKKPIKKLNFEWYGG